MNTDRTLIVVPTYNERENVAALVAQLLEVAPEADVCLRVDNWPLRRRLLSRFANRYVCAITGLRVGDATGGFRCYTRRALGRLLEGRVNAEGYAFLVETVFRASRAGLSVAEVPITFTDRREGQSKM